jgi:hypothetical protein
MRNSYLPTPTTAYPDIFDVTSMLTSAVFICVAAVRLKALAYAETEV